MSTSFLLLNVFLALISLSGAAVAWLRFYSLREQVNSNYSRIMSIQSKQGMDEQKIRDAVEDHVPRVLERTGQAQDGGGMDEGMMNMMMAMMSGGMGGQMQGSPAQQQPQDLPTSEGGGSSDGAQDETLEEQGGILDTIDRFSQDE